MTEEIKTKVCKKCGQSLEVNKFPVSTTYKDGRKPLCKLCYNKQMREYNAGIDAKEKKKQRDKKYRTENRVVLNKKRNEWNKQTDYRKTPAQKKYHKEYKKRPYVKEKISLYNKYYSKKRWEKVKASKPPVIPLTEKEIIEKGHYLKLKVRLILQVKKGLRRQDATKQYKTIELIGCSYTELLNYLESLFTEGMTWENRGYYGWHIDHKMPLDSFNLNNKEEQKRAFHYTNLQPLWWRDNLLKSNKILVA